MKYLYHNTLPLYFNGFVLGLRGIQLFQNDGPHPAIPDTTITPQGISNCKHAVWRTAI